MKANTNQSKHCHPSPLVEQNRTILMANTEKEIRKHGRAEAQKLIKVATDNFEASPLTAGAV